MQDKKEMLITLHHCQRRQWADEVSPSDLLSHTLAAELTYGTSTYSHLRGIYTCLFRPNTYLWPEEHLERDIGENMHTPCMGIELPSSYWEPC